MKTFLAAATPLALLPLLASCGAEPPPAPPPESPNVLLISIDSLRADHLSCYGYERKTSPAIDFLASEGILFENAMSSSSWTLPAHSALFTALPDTSHRTERTNSQLANDYRTLAEQMRDAGYHTAGFWSGPFLDPSFGLGQGFDEYVDCRTPFEVRDGLGKMREQKEVNDVSHEDITSPRILSEVKEWFGRRGDRPFFLFVHMWDVHFDYIPPEPYDTLFDPTYDGPANGRNISKTLDPSATRDVEHTIALYDGEIAWTDKHVGELLALLDEHGVSERTLVVLTADHGEEFFEHGDFGHRRTLFDESVRVPLILRLPDRAGAGRREAGVVSITDIAPTILDYAGVPALDDVFGEPLITRAGDLAADRRPIIVSEIFTRDPERGPIVALRTDAWKLIVRRRGDIPHGVYDLTADPGERANLLEQGGPVVDAALAALPGMQEQLQGSRDFHTPSEAGETDLAPEMEAELRSLGYIGDEEE